MILLYRQIVPAVKLTLLLALLTGLLFPGCITLIAQLIFPDQARGSLVLNSKGTIIGSRLLGQKFAGANYFHPRPSAAGSGYAGEASGGTNLAATSAKLIQGQADDPKTEGDESFAGVTQLAQKYRHENGLSDSEALPADSVTRSGSGLDPDISVQNAMLQVSRIARARAISYDKLATLVRRETIEREFGIFGEPRVNVLLLNLELDKLAQTMKATGHGRSTVKIDTSETYTD